MSPTCSVVTVTTAATRVQVSATSILCARITFEPMKANTGRIGIGDSTVVLSTGVGLAIDMAAPGSGATGLVPSETIETQDSINKLDLSDYWADASVNAQKVRVTYWN